MLFSRLRLPITNWRLMLVQAPARHVDLGRNYDLKPKVLRGQPFHDIRGPIVLLLLPVALGQLTHGPVQVHVQPLGQIGDPLVVVQAPEPRQVPGDLPGAHPRPQLHVPRQAPSPGVDRHAVPARVQAEHAGRSCGRPQVANQQP
jgi:hypothetical protein